MKKWTLLMFILTMTTIMQAQDFVRENDKKTDKVLLRGKLTFADVMDETVNKWLIKGAAAYHPNEEVIKALKSVMQHYRLVIFMGTWCEDTQVLLPQLYKTLKDAGFDMNAIEMYGVNRKKEALNIEHKFYNIERVPTIIVMHQYREVGRIIESVSGSIEEALLNIMLPDAQKLEAKRAAKQ
ncbi:MAG: thioredoxin family protein [Chitinophagaceae bacterium]|nr:thioredoxin family protein [Chitinophagaceae bacterium]